MAGTGFDPWNTAGGNADFGKLAQQYWNAWGSMFGAPAPAPAASPFGAPWFVPPSAPPPSPMEGADAALRQFGAQAMAWYGQMQQLASEFAGRDAGAAEIAHAWQQMLRQAGASSPMSAMGSQGWASPFAHGMPGLQGLRDWMQLPTFGFTREHQERWQKVMQAQMDVQEHGAAFAGLMSETLRDAAERFERKLSERSEPGKQLESARALFDLWIDAAEESYADIALSERYRATYGAFVDAQMRARAAMQAEVEQACSQVGMPTRTEIDASHRKIVQLERTVRRLRDAVEQLQANSGAQAATARATPAEAAPPQADGTLAQAIKPDKASKANPASAGKPRAGSKGARR